MNLRFVEKGDHYSELGSQTSTMRIFSDYNDPQHDQTTIPADKQWITPKVRFGPFWPFVTIFLKDASVRFGQDFLALP